MKTLLSILSCAFVAQSAHSAEAPVLSAKDLAAKLSLLQQDGSSFVRLKLDAKPPAGTPKFSLQLQIKQRRTAKSTEVVYQILWPKERMGEAVLLKQSAGGAASGSLFNPSGTVRALGGPQMKEALFGSDLSYADVLENFFAWDNQAIVGSEVVDRVNCQILESKPGKGGSSYSVVRTWVDTRRLVPLRIEKYLPSGAVARRIDTRDVAKDDTGRSVPANLTVSSPQKSSSTDLTGSKLKHGVALTDHDFTPAGIKDLAVPKSGPQ
ncbi:MAG: outer membrane lipoprotein-sorting protein [Verrucomicrobiota bacterium]